MRSRVVSLSLALVAMLGVVSGWRDIQAQDATPDATPDATEAMATMATHPVVGTWELTGELADNTFPILAMFHADGTYQEIYP